MGRDKVMRRNGRQKGRVGEERRHQSWGSQLQIQPPKNVALNYGAFSCVSHQVKITRND
jgi:hypothetical protein